MAAQNNTTTLLHLTPSEAVADALYRACLAIDTDDRTLFDSAWIQSSDKEGPNAPTFSVVGGKSSVGNKAIRQQLFDTVGPMDTHHMISNVRVNFKGEEGGEEVAEMTAYAHAMHHRAGEGMQPDKKGLLGGTIYELELVKDGEVWRMKKWVNRIVWVDGDMSVMGR